MRARSARDRQGLLTPDGMVCIVRRSAEEDDDIDEPSARPGLTDVEDLGGVVAANRGGKGAAGGGVAIVEKPKRMLNDRLAQLMKETLGPFMAELQAQVGNRARNRRAWVGDILV